MTLEEDSGDIIDEIVHESNHDYEHVFWAVTNFNYQQGNNKSDLLHDFIYRREKIYDRKPRVKIKSSNNVLLLYLSAMYFTTYIDIRFKQFFIEFIVTIAHDK